MILRPALSDPPVRKAGLTPLLRLFVLFLSACPQAAEKDRTSLALTAMRQNPTSEMAHIEVIAVLDPEFAGLQSTGSSVALFSGSGGD